MSLASAYAASISTDSATLAQTVSDFPAPYLGPILQAAVRQDGSCQITVPSTGSVYNVPAAIVLAFADWAVATFR